MSASAFVNSKVRRRLCRSCQDRKARFAFRGRVKADRDHTLCFECYRAERDRRRASALARLPPPGPLPWTARAEPLTAEQVQHRRRMLQHLSGCQVG